MKRKYIRTQKAYYWNNEMSPTPEVMIQIFEDDDEDNFLGEFPIEWDMVYDNIQWARLKMFDDAWHLLPHVTDLLNQMSTSGGNDIQEEEFCELLDSLGFEDATQYTNPNDNKEEPNPFPKIFPKTSTMHHTGAYRNNIWSTADIIIGTDAETLWNKMGKTYQDYAQQIKDDIVKLGKILQHIDKINNLR